MIDLKSWENKSDSLFSEMGLVIPVEDPGSELVKVKKAKAIDKLWRWLFQAIVSQPGYPNLNKSNIVIHLSNYVLAKFPDAKRISLSMQGSIADSVRKMAAEMAGPAAILIGPSAQPVERMTYQLDADDFELIISCSHKVKITLVRKKRKQLFFDNVQQSEMDPISSAIYKQILLYAEELELKPQLEKWNRPFHLLFEDQVYINPERIALVNLKHNAPVQSYGELNKEINQIAHYLISNNILKDKLVAIISDDMNEFVKYFIAVHKIGAAYVPIDPKMGASAIKVIIDDSKPDYFLIEESCQHKIDINRAKPIFVLHKSIYEGQPTIILKRAVKLGLMTSLMSCILLVVQEGQKAQRYYIEAYLTVSKEPDK